VAIPKSFCSPLDNLESPPHADPILLFEVSIVKSRSRRSFDTSARRWALPLADDIARRCASSSVSTTESAPMSGTSCSRYAESLRRRCSSREFHIVSKPSSRMSPAAGVILWPRIFSRVHLPAPLQRCQRDWTLHDVLQPHNYMHTVTVTCTYEGPSMANNLPACAVPDNPLEKIPLPRPSNLGLMEMLCQENLVGCTRMGSTLTSSSSRVSPSLISTNAAI